MAFAKRFEDFSPATMAQLPLLSRMAFDFAFTLAKWQMRSATRASLRKLSDHLLHDVGLDASQAQSECLKRFWQD